jgi:DNA-directed RNA polymerase subunit RPC12/RpoP
VYNQNASAAGVTYNCGGEIPTLFPRVRPPPFTRVSRIPRLTSSPPRVTRTDCGSEVVLRPGDIVICRECGYRILYKKRTKQSTSTGSPTCSVFLREPPSPGASVSGATASRTESDRPFTGFPSAVVQFEAR